MQIKKYTAVNMTQALKLIKDDWGGEAFVISCRTITKGNKRLSGSSLIEVTAAREIDEGGSVSTDSPEKSLSSWKKVAPDSEMFSDYYQKLIRAGLNEDIVLKVLVNVKKEKDQNETNSPEFVKEKIKEKLKVGFIQQMDKLLNTIL